MLTLRSQPQEEVDLCQALLTKSILTALSLAPYLETMGLCVEAEVKNWKDICMPLLPPQGVYFASK